MLVVFGEDDGEKEGEWHCEERDADTLVTHITTDYNIMLDAISPRALEQGH